MSREDKFDLHLKTATLLFVIALVFRLMILVAAPGIGDKPGLDSDYYTGIAHNLLAGNGYSIAQHPGVPSNIVAPAFPWFVAGVFAISNESLLAVKLAQAVLGALTVVLVFWLAGILFGPSVALLGALFFAFHPEMAGLPGFIYTETLFIFLLTAGMLLAVIAERRESVPIWFAAGLVLGLAALCRANILPIAGFFFIGYLIARVNWKKALLWSAVTGVGMAIVVIPWTIRNYVVFHEFVPVADRAGVTLWQGNYLPFDGRFSYRDSERLERALGVDSSGKQLSGAALDKKMTQIAVQGMREHPIPTAWLTMRKVGRLWLEVYEAAPSGGKRTRNVLITLVLGIWHYLLMPLAVWGVIITRKFKRDLVLVYVLLVFMTLVCAATMAVPRYRYPMMPYVCMFAGAGLLNIWKRKNNLKEMKAR